MIIKNATIVTFDESNQIIPDGYVLIHNRTIRRIGEMKDLEEVLKEEKLDSTSEDIMDAGGKLMMPGFICAHTHMYSAFARGMCSGGCSPSNFNEILEKVWWKLDKKLTHMDIYYSCMVTLMQCMKSGVTAVFDHHSGPASIDGSLDVVEKALVECGMRGVLCYEVSDRDGESAALKGIKENLRFIDKCNKKIDPSVKGMFGLHASFTLSDKTLEHSSAVGNAYDSGFHVHVAEGEHDQKFTRDKYHNTVVERLKSFKMLNEKSIFAHCIHLSEREKELLRDVNVVHNPESNMNNAVGCCDVLDLHKRGAIVGLGSDGFSSDPFRAMDVCYVLHKHEKKDPTVMTADMVKKLAVDNNAKIASKHFDLPLGVIKAGAKADLIFLKYNSPTPLNSANICDHMIFGMNSGCVTDTMINGEVIMRNREILRLDEERIYAKSRCLAKKLWDRM